MKKLAFLVALASTPALAHPNGTYVLDDNADATATFLAVGRCPAVEGALTGTKRTITFSEVAAAEPYNFVTGFYVEIHEGEQEIYVNTDEQCVPETDGARIPAGRSEFGGYSLRRVR